MDKIKLSKEMFSFENKTSEVEGDLVYQGSSFWNEVWTRYMKNKGAVIGMIFIMTIIILALFGPFLNSYKYDTINEGYEKLPPRIPVVEKFGIFDGTKNGENIYEEKGLDDRYFIFGTDTLGRDIWTRVWVGTRVSLVIALLAVGIDMLIGLSYGLISGYFGGKVDMVMQRFIEIISGIPNLVLVTILMLIFGAGIISIILALLITGWIGMSRVARSQVLRLREAEFVLAGKTLGASDLRIIFKDILPNIFGQLIIMSMFSIPNAIFYESFLAFVGLGIQPPLASLGVLINDGYKQFLTNPYMIISPIIVLSILMLSFNLVADGLRDAFDVKLKES